MKEKQDGLGLVGGLLSIAVVAVLGIGGWYVWKYHNNHAIYDGTVQADEVKFSGKITRDGCWTNGSANTNGGTGFPIGDVGCSITVDGYDIGVRLGNIRPPDSPGTVAGLDVNHDQTGRSADVYAKKTAPNSASIWDASKYYVHIH